MVEGRADFELREIEELVKVTCLGLEADLGRGLPVFLYLPLLDL